jgi:hypothetical protein
MSFRKMFGLNSSVGPGQQPPPPQVPKSQPPTQIQHVATNSNGAQLKPPVVVANGNNNASSTTSANSSNSNSSNSNSNKDEIDLNISSSSTSTTSSTPSTPSVKPPHHVRLQGSNSGGGGTSKAKSKRIAQSARIAASSEAARLSLASSILAHFLTRDNHTNFSVAGAVCPPRLGTLFEYFFVVGASLERAAQINRPAPHPVMVDPVILYQFPDAPVAPDLRAAVQQLPNFAFPSAVDVRALEPGGSLSHQQEVMFGPLAAFERIGPSFIFLLSGSDTILYGICVAKPEFVDVLPSMLTPSAATRPTTPTNAAAATGASGARSGATAPAAPGTAPTTALTTRCYVFLTRFPFFHLHFEVMYAVLASERLDALQRMGGEHRSAVSSALAILREYYTLPVPDEDKASIFELSSTLHHVKFSSPTGHEDKLIGQWSLPPFVCLLTLPNIITLLNAAMLERRIVFVSSNIGYLSACVLSIVPLLRPFIWQGTYVPVLPNTLREYLQAPVPYIMGVHESPHKMTEFRRSLDPATIVVLIDTNEIVLGSGSPAASVLPPLPHADVIATNLEPHTTKLRALSQKKMCGQISPEVAATVAEFSHELTVYHNWLYGSIRKGLRTYMRRKAMVRFDSVPTTLTVERPPLPPTAASTRETRATDPHNRPGLIGSDFHPDAAARATVPDATAADIALRAVVAESTTESPNTRQRRQRAVSDAQAVPFDEHTTVTTANVATALGGTVVSPPTPPASPTLSVDDGPTSSIGAGGGGGGGGGNGGVEAAVAAFDFDEIESNIDQVILCFSSKHHAFLREFLLTQHFLFFATRVASATDKLTLVDQKLSELGALLRTRSPAANAQRINAAMAKKPDFDSIMSTPVAGRRGSTNQLPPRQVMDQQQPGATKSGGSKLQNSQSHKSSQNLLHKSSKLSSSINKSTSTDSTKSTVTALSDETDEEETDETDSETASDSLYEFPVRRFSTTSSSIDTVDTAATEPVDELEL